MNTVGMDYRRLRTSRTPLFVLALSLNFFCCVGSSEHPEVPAQGDAAPRPVTPVTPVRTPTRLLTDASVTRLAQTTADAQASTPPKAPAFVKWTSNDIVNFKNFKYNWFEEIDVPNKQHLKAEHAIVDKACIHIDCIDSGPFFTTQTLESIPNGEITKLSGVFLHMQTAKWVHPIPGEVKYVNDTRYQFVGQAPNDPYGVVIASDNFEQVYTSGVSTNFKVSIDQPWSDSDQTKLGEGSYGYVWTIHYNGRTFVAKSNRYSGNTFTEVDAYEKLHGVPGIGPYIGQIGQQFVLLQKGEPLALFIRKQPGSAAEFIKSLLQTVGAMHAKHVFHNDIKVGNIIVVDNKPYLIDFGSFSTYSWRLERLHGFTRPYYAEGEETGVQADLRALGFVAFAITHFNDPAFTKDFIELDDGGFGLKAKLKPEAIANELANKDQLDQLITKLLKKEFRDASEALASMH